MTDTSTAFPGDQQSFSRVETFCIAATKGKTMPHRAVHLLLVEDDEVDAEWIVRAFGKLEIPYLLTVVPDGVEALNVLRGEGGRERLPRPYVIILDLNLPRMNGIDFLRAIRKDDALQQSVVFVLTTSSNEMDMVAAYALHAAGYFRKVAHEGSHLALPAMLENYWRLVELPPDET